MFSKTLLAIAVGAAINENFRDASLQLVLKELPCAAPNFFPPILENSFQESFQRYSRGVTTYPQNSRPIRQPHCPRQAHARQREKAAARELANNA